MITSLFDDGILLFNRNAKEATVELPMPAGQWERGLPGPARERHSPAAGHPVADRLQQSLGSRTRKTRKSAETKYLTFQLDSGGDKAQADPLMHKLKEHLDAKNFEEAENIPNSILKMMVTQEYNR